MANRSSVKFVRSGSEFAGGYAEGGYCSRGAVVATVAGTRHTFDLGPHDSPVRVIEDIRSALKAGTFDPRDF